MHYQQAGEADYQGILDLQKRNFVDNLSELEKQSGFLSVAFTREQFAIMNQQTGIIVCKDSDNVCGYLCTSLPEFNKSFALTAAMLDLYSKLSFKNQLLASYPSVIVGPWCIAQDHRGLGIFEKMWSCMNNILPKNIDLMTTCISTKNPASFYAAQKVGMKAISTFEFNQKEFYILVRQRPLTGIKPGK